MYVLYTEIYNLRVNLQIVQVQNTHRCHTSPLMYKKHEWMRGAWGTGVGCHSL